MILEIKILEQRSGKRINIEECFLVKKKNGRQASAKGVVVNVLYQAWSERESQKLQ
jgi:hypothetical protein